MLQATQLRFFAEELAKTAKVDTSAWSPGDVLTIETDMAKFQRKRDAPAVAFSHIFRGATQSLQGPLSHAAIYVGDGDVVESRMGEGVVRQKARKALKGKKFLVHRPKVPAGDRREAAEFAKKQVGKDYDSLAVVATAGGLLLPEKIVRAIDEKVFHPPEKAEKYTCSSLVQAAYRKAELTKGGRRVIAPADLRVSKKLKLVVPKESRNYKEKAPVIGRIRGRWHQRETA